MNSMASAGWGLLAWLCCLVSSLPAQDSPPYRSKPKGHEQNRQQVSQTYLGNVKKYANDTNRLVLPGLVADQRRQRIEMLVERTGVGPDAPCEFTIISETSDHGYEALLIAFAKPSDVHRALEFIGQAPGEPFDPGSLRFWAKGEPFVLSLAATNEPPRRIEELLLDRRTGQSLRNEGFLFTGSRRVPALTDPQKQVYAADEYQPKSIVSLFNATDTVLQVPYLASKEMVYQNTIVNPAWAWPEGTLLTLVIESARNDGSKWAKDLVLQVAASPSPDGKPWTGLERLTSLNLLLKNSEGVLNAKPTVLSVVESLALLDRKKHAYYLTVRFEEDVQLGQAQALAKILSSIDCEQGVRIEPPPAGQLYYKAFTPDEVLLDRQGRIFHPWELSVTEKDGQVLGHLLSVESVWKEGAAASELAITDTPVSGPRELGKELEAEVARVKRTNQRAKPPVIMVFAPATLTYGRLKKFLDPALPTHPIIHVYVDIPRPPIPQKKPQP